MQVAGQAQVSYTWDNADRLTAITQGSSAVGINYDNANRRTSLTLPNGVTVGYSVDNDSRITGLTYSAGSTQLGNLIYGYDADGRVTSKNGTLAAISLPNSVSGNTFNADNGMTGFNGTTLTYDANGNLTNDGTNTYTWDARNHLTGISGAVAASFVYDALGRRMSKNINGTATQFLYDWLNPVQEIQAGAPSANLLTGGRLDEYFARTDSSNNVSTLLQDALGSTIGLVVSAQTIGTAYTYEPFGATTTAGAANGNSYQFTGRETDGTGLYFYRARYYSPTFQRFTAQDPIGFVGPNLYEYASNSPITLADPTGLWTITIGWTGNFSGQSTTGTATIALAIDSSGGVAVTGTIGGGLLTTTGGAQESDGLSIGFSNAKTVCDLSGPFVEATVGGGAGAGGAGSVFGGTSPDGTVVGVNLTVGEGAGLGIGVSGTQTTVVPLFNLGSLL